MGFTEKTPILSSTFLHEKNRTKTKFIKKIIRIELKIFGFYFITDEWKILFSVQ